METTENGGKRIFVLATEAPPELAQRVERIRQSYGFKTRGETLRQILARGCALMEARPL